MKLIYLDANRDLPSGNLYDVLCRTDEQALKFIRKAYKAGTTTFFLDIPDDTAILVELRELRNSGKMRHLKIKLHCHEDIDAKIFVEANKDWVELYD